MFRSASLIGGPINTTVIRANWDDILRLAASIRNGTVTASLMLRKLGSYHDKTASQSRSAKSDGSNTPCSSSTGSKASTCDNA